MVERRVFFQGEKRAPQIHVVDVETENGKPCINLETSSKDKMLTIPRTDEQIKETDNAKEPSPLAVCNVKNGAGDDVNYLYYVDKKNNLWRATGRDKDEFRSNPVLRKQEPVTISSSSQLAVTPGPKHNLVSYTVEKDGKHLLTFFADRAEIDRRPVTYIFAGTRGEPRRKLQKDKSKTLEIQKQHSFSIVCRHRLVCCASNRIFSDDLMHCFSPIL